MLKIERNHPVCMAVPSAPGLCVVGNTDGIQCGLWGVTFGFQGRFFSREGETGT